jgi:hypothetical protein
MIKFEEWYENYCIDEDGRSITQQDIRNAFIAGQESGDKEIRRLKERLTSCKLNAQNTIDVIGEAI